MWNDQSGGFGQNAGGFLNTTTSSPSVSDKKKPERISNVVPCTIAQIHSIPESEDNLRFGSLTAKMVTFVGWIFSVDSQTTKVTYFIDDCTGPGIEVQLWVPENDEQNRAITIFQELTYVKVTGSVRSLKGKRHVIAFHIAPIKSLNEITMHMAEVVHVRMSVKIMDKQAQGNSNVGGGYDSSSLLSGISSADTFSSTDSKLSRPQMLVKQAIMNCKDEQGISVREIRNNLKSLTPQSIQEALNFLSNEGHIYSTIDEEHFKSTDCV